MMLENCRSRRRHLSAAWIDYRKAFDNVSHSWILKTLEMYKVSPVVVNFLKQSMGMWKTTSYLNHTRGTATSNYLNIRRGIFQGDFLLPLLFCLSLISLTHELKNNDHELTGLLNSVKWFSDDIGMDFGLDKCAKVTFKKGRIIETH